MTPKPADLRRSVERYVAVMHQDAPLSDEEQGLLAPAANHLRLGELFVPSKHGFFRGREVLSREVGLLLAASIFEALGPGNPFFGPVEILQRLLYGVFGDAEDIPKGTVESILDCLTAEPRRWRFKVSLALNGMIGLQESLGGSAVLSLTLESTGARHHTLLTGEVSAPTWMGAKYQTERHAEVLLGAGLALGLIRADLIDIYLTKDSRPIFEVDGQPWTMGSGYRSLIDWVRMETPRDMSELELSLFKTGATANALQRHIRVLGTIATDVTARAEEVRNACRLAIRAATTLDYGLAISLAFSVVEGLLLERDARESTSARLIEAVAHSIGRSAVERRRLRKRVRELYEHRSAFLHTGTSQETARGRQHALDLMTRVLRREMELLG